MLAVVPNLSSAHAEDAGATTDTGVTASVSPTASPKPSNSIRDRLRTELDEKNQNIKTNQMGRNQLLEQHKNLGSTTHPMMKDMRASTTEARKEIRDDRREEVKNIREEGRENMHNASSSEDRKEIRRDMRFDIFGAKKEALVKQLNLSISNLKQVRARIIARIEKVEQNGKSMTEARKLLAVADLKIEAAQTAVNTLQNLPAPAISTSTPPTDVSTSGSTTAKFVNIDKHRKIGNDAMKAVKDAREALMMVVRSIAHSMGLDNNRPASTTPPTGESATSNI
jgi:hypothetical protein